MKIKYSPYYDAEVFLKNNSQFMGTFYAGNQKLLEQLELRAAFPQTTKSEVEREADYLNAMRKHIKGSLFEKSAQVDELGVARRLLQWRDALLMAGWDGTCNDRKLGKLSVLADIEQDFHSKGNADRWRAIVKIYSKEAVLQDTEIDVECPWSELPRLVQLTLEGIEQHGCTVRRCNEDEAVADIDIDKIRVVEFKDVNYAYEWIATAKQLPENTLVVNRNNTRLNHILYTWNKPRIATTLRDSNPQVLQLFKLGMSIFSRPLNVQNVVSYLQLPLSPIPAPLRRDLAKLLLEKGGFGEPKMREDGHVRNEWDETIANYEFLNKDGKPTPQEREKRMVFIAPICKEDYSKGIGKEDLDNYVADMLRWISGFGADKNLTDGLKTQLVELKTFFNALSTALQDMPDTVPFKDIEGLVQSIYRPINYSGQPTEQGAMAVVADIRQMAEPANGVIWLDCQAEDRERDEYDFLSQDERDYLERNGVVLPDFQRHLSYARSERLRKLKEVEGMVTLVKSEYDGTTRLGEHSLIAEMKHAYRTAYPDTAEALPTVAKEDVLKSMPFETEDGNVEIFEPAAAYELDELTGLGRKESNSSLDTLINYPFDYVMQYVAKLYQPDEEQVNNTFITLGLVAHSFFEHIITDAGDEFAIMKKMANEEFAQRLDAAIDATGLILRLPENASELENFTKHLKESFLSLVAIMEGLKLKPVGCEMSLPDEAGELPIDGIGAFGARIDFLLTDADGNYVVFDFKWSYSNKYEDNLKDNIAVQLELYRQAVLETYEGKRVRGVGYYIMPRKVLVTSDFNEIEGSRLVKHIESKDTNLFEQIKNSYVFRMAELERGHIEEAEEIDIKDDTGCYYAQQEEQNLCPLKVKEKTSGRGANKQVVYKKKESNRVFRPSKKPKFDQDDLTPSEISTKNAILKGRLK